MKKNYLPMRNIFDDTSSDRDTTTTIETDEWKDVSDFNETRLRVIRHENSLQNTSASLLIKSSDLSDNDNISYDSDDFSDRYMQISNSLYQDDDLSLSDDDNHSVRSHDEILSDGISMASDGVVLNHRKEYTEGIIRDDNQMCRDGFSSHRLGHIYQFTSDESMGREEDQIYESESIHSNYSDRNHYPINFSIEKSDEEESLSFENCEHDRFSSMPELPMRPLHDFDITYNLKTSNDCKRSKIQEVGPSNQEERSRIDRNSFSPESEDIARIRDDKVNDIHTEFSRNRSLGLRRLLKKSTQAHEVISRQNQNFHELITRFADHARERRKRKRIRKEKEKSKQKQKSRIIIIPADHPLKILWDLFTILLTFISAYTTHQNIKDRKYESTTFAFFTEAWFFMDIILNFITAHRHSDGTIICNGSAVWGRYLTTWFPIDMLSLIRWEGMLLKPIIEKQNRRNIITKWFFRSKATIKVTRILRGHHIKIFGRVVNSTKKIGVGSRRLLALIIKYVPKYILFYRNMKGVLVLKVLRQIHFGRKVVNNLTTHPSEGEEEEEEEEEEEDEDEEQE